jgi:linoleoyl-CoA desaturase
MYTLMGLRWQTVGDLHAFRRGSVGESALRRPRGWTLFGVVAGKAFFITWALVIPMLVYPWWGVLGAYVFFTMITSLIMATTFQLAHCVEEASFASADELRAERRIWAVHEVETTVDFCPRNPVLTWMLGGLNFQIEHHLFPKVPHTHYPKIAEIVRRNCLKHDVRYSFNPSLGRALRSHFLHLREMGRLGLPPEIEMG